MNSRKTVVGAGVAIVTAIFGGINVSAEEVAVKEHVVTIAGFEFVPDELSIRVGDTITWVNEDIVPHTATSKDGSWDTGTIKQNESSSLTVTEEMTASYFCRFHINMIGSAVLDR